MDDIIYTSINGKRTPLTGEDLAEYQQRVADAAARAAAEIHAAMDAYIDTVRDLRERILNRLAGIALRAQIAGNQFTLTAYMAACQRLLDITKAPGVSAATDKDSLEAAIKAEYASIVASVPDSLKTAFDQLDQ